MPVHTDTTDSGMPVHTDTVCQYILQQMDDQIWRVKASLDLFILRTIFILLFTAVSHVIKTAVSCTKCRVTCSTLLRRIDCVRSLKNLHVDGPQRERKVMRGGSSRFYTGICLLRHAQQRSTGRLAYSGVHLSSGAIRGKNGESGVDETSRSWSGFRWSCSVWYIRMIRMLYLVPGRRYSYYTYHIKYQKY